MMTALGTPETTKFDEFLEKVQTAFDPALPHFEILQFFSLQNSGPKPTV